MTKFKRYRVSNFMTQKQLADKLGVSHASVSRWESGRDLPHPKRYEKMARLLKVSPLALTQIVAEEIPTSPAQ